MKEYNMCKKCSYGCCKTKVTDTLDELWHKICSSKSEEISLFGDGAVISLLDLQKLIDAIKE